MIVVLVVYTELKIPNSNLLVMRIYEIIKILNKRYRINVERENPFDVLIGAVLSHRTKDEVSWPATERLLRKANTPDKISKLSEKEIVKIIKPVGFYNQKAKRIVKICKTLLKVYDGKVPRTRKELMTLPGVGGKTADIVLSYSFGELVIPVDTHVAVVSKRLGLTENKEPEKIREDLHRLIKGKKRLIVNNLFVEFGKEICQKRLPKCYTCPIVKSCPYEPKNLKIPLK